MDFFSASVYHSMDITHDLFTPIFAVSRTSGWIAHIRFSIANDISYNSLCPVSSVIFLLISRKYLARGSPSLPNVDFFSASVYHSMDIPHDLFTPIFAVSRTSGWIAHFLHAFFNS
jgi:citrate synthase